MAKFYCCPKCSSLALARQGVASELDGMRLRVCLECGQKVPPVRPKTVYAVVFVFALLAVIPFCYAGTFGLRQSDSWHYALFMVFGAVGCPWIAYQSWRVLRAPVSALLNGANFPSESVSLVKCRIDIILGDGPLLPAWSAPLAAVIGGALRAAGECLHGAGKGCKVWIEFECHRERWAHRILFSKNPDRAALGKLEDALAVLPQFGTYGPTVNVELWFRLK